VEEPCCVVGLRQVEEPCCVVGLRQVDPMWLLVLFSRLSSQVRVSARSLLGNVGLAQGAVAYAVAWPQTGCRAGCPNPRRQDAGRRTDASVRGEGWDNSAALRTNPRTETDALGAPRAVAGCLSAGTWRSAGCAWSTMVPTTASSSPSWTCLTRTGYALPSPASYDARVAKPCAALSKPLTDRQRQASQDPGVGHDSEPQGAPHRLPAFALSFAT
jgi:hypothetical protein